jgi:hypothetical protein
MLEIHVAQSSDIVGKHVRYVTSLIGARVQVLSINVPMESFLVGEFSGAFHETVSNYFH